jgi:hypothetical protein
MQSGMHGTVSMFELTGNPDLVEPVAPTQPTDIADEQEQAQGEPKRWTVAELTFPVLLPSEAGSGDAGGDGGAIAPGA